MLVVDDEVALRKLFKRTLSGLGYRVTLQEDGKSAVEYYRTHVHEVDVVLMDVMMPRMNGPDAFREMKKINQFVRVIFQSGCSLDAEGEQLLAEGACGIMLKPSTRAELSSMISRALLA